MLIRVWSCIRLCLFMFASSGAFSYTFTIVWCFLLYLLLYLCFVFALVFVLCLTHLHLCCPGLSTCGHVAAQFWLRPALWPPLVCSRKLSGLWSGIKVRVLSRVLYKYYKYYLECCIRVQVLSRVLCRAQLSMLNLIAPPCPKAPVSLHIQDCKSRRIFSWKSD